MNDELNIPLLQDLVSRGEPDIDEQQQHLGSDENMSVEIEQDEIESSQSDPKEIQTIKEVHSFHHHQPSKSDNLTDDASVRELIIDEEIRMILDKHMDKAYEEIIRLLNHRIS